MFREHSISERFVWLLALSWLVFFSHWWLRGLQPDAALYAGLSSKVLRTQEFWLLSGSPAKYPQFFEHPPFFFQWGAEVLRAFGSSDGAARAIGGIPGALAFLSLLVWVWCRMGWLTAFLTGLMLATFTSYTKFASTALMEGPLSLAVCWVAIASFESHWRVKTSWRRPIFWLPLFVGLSLACASKGVVGFGAWGGLGLSLLFALFFSEREPFKVLFSFFFMGFALLVAFAPLGYWIFKMLSLGGKDWITGYFFQQVFKSATSNRGELSHPLTGDKLYYVKLILRDGWPWWWTVAGGCLGVLLWPLMKRRVAYQAQRFWQSFHDPIYRGWTWNALAYFLAFFIPLSFVRYQLPHYIHATYLVMMPVGARFLENLFPKHWPLQKISQSWKIRWALVVGCGAIVILTSRGVTHTPNRGQEFMSIADKIESLPDKCLLQVSHQSMDDYRMEAYALWYLKGRQWESIENHVPAKIAVAKYRIYWEPENNILWGKGDCRL